MIGTAVITGATVSAAYISFKKNRTKMFKSENVCDLKYFFSKSKSSPQTELIKIINNARETIDVAVYYITENQIVTHLCKATERGVKVRIITDKDDRYQESALNKLLNSGIPIKVNTYKGLMHLKNMIVDQEIVSTGSYNFTQKAETGNEEVVVIFNGHKIAKEWSARFDEMWNDEFNYTAYKQGYSQKYA